MGLFGGGNEASKRFREAERFSHPKKKEFDLDKAISLLEEVVSLKPADNKYRQKLEEIRELKLKGGMKFFMRARYPKAATFPNKKQGLVVSGTIEQGIIRDGDEILIAGSRGTIFEVIAPTGKGNAIAGQDVTLAIITEGSPSFNEPEFTLEAT